MAEILTADKNVAVTAKLAQFKDYAVSHPQLVQVERVLRRAIREPAGFAHVLVYGPSGVGKTTMIRQIARRFQEAALDSISAPPSYPNGSSAPVPLLLLETRPPDGGAFNRADYYRTALKLLGEPFYERRLLVDVDSEQAWEKKGRSRRQATQFNDSPELRHALEAAMARRGVRAVILDEAQHLLKIGSGSSGGKLLDQLDWIKSMTNVTGVLHILIGTYELLNFRNLSGQASRRGLELHFPRYLFQHEQDRDCFQGVLLALLKQVPLSTDIPALMQHWFYFYERSIGCVGVLKDWLIRAVAAALHDGGDTLTRERVEEHALTLSQCERMALDAIEGEQKLGYSESRREQLWRLLQAGMEATAVPAPVASTVADAQSQETTPAPPSPPKTSRTKRSSASKPKTAIKEVEVLTEPAPKKRQAQKKRKKPAEPTQETSPDADSPVSKAPSPENPPEEPTPSRKKPARRVGQRQPKRDPVG